METLQQEKDMLEGSRKDTKEREKQVILWLISLSGVRMLIL
jgi:hypothetical protein